ncbi:MAG TPA: MBL fold metallo-hydrolase [Dehalococcoidia bacterium]|nr:MBL fold metallo-hydrolase [Dehalococcoidia bacterium]
MKFDITMEPSFLYNAWKLNTDTYIISHKAGAVYIYLLLGRQKALLIDTGYGTGNLRKFVENLTGLPVDVVNTHGHFDHSGGDGWWNAVYASPYAIPGMKSRPAGIEVDKQPYPDFKVIPVTDKFTFDLGDRIVEVIEIPAHSEGSVALLDHGSKILFTGDEIEAGQVWLFSVDGRKKSIEKHLSNMLLLQQRSSEFEILCPGHNGTPIAKEYIDDCVSLDEQIINGSQQNTNSLKSYVLEQFPFARQLKRAEYGVASVIYFPQQ